MLQWTAALVAGLLISLVACQKRDLHDVKPKEAGAQHSALAVDLAQKEKSQYVAKARKEIDDAKVEISRLQAKLQTANARNKAELEDDVRLLKEKRDVVERRLDQVQLATAKTWGEIRADLDRALNDLQYSAAKTTKEFR